MGEATSSSSRGKRMKKLLRSDHQVILVQWVRMRQLWEHSSLPPASSGNYNSFSRSENSVTDPWRIIMLPFSSSENICSQLLNYLISWASTLSNFEETNYMLGEIRKFCISRLAILGVLVIEMTVCQSESCQETGVRAANESVPWVAAGCQTQKPKIRLMTLNLAGQLGKTGTPVVLLGRTVPSPGNKPLCPGVHPLFQLSPCQRVCYLLFGLLFGAGFQTLSARSLPLFAQE